MKVEVMKKIHEMFKKDDSKMVYLTKFGSHLYGTSTPSSDSDYKGLFFPSLRDLVLQVKCNSKSYTTGNTDSRNSTEDVDIQFWSVQYWMTLLGKGDTNAIDLLFSMFTKDDSVRRSPKDDITELLGDFVNHPVDLIDLKHNTAYIAYAFMQCKKYGLRGSKVAMLQNCLEFFRSKFTGDNERKRVEIYFDELLSKYKDDSLCFEKETNGERCVWICGKGLTGSTSLEETISRLTYSYKSYGARSIEAANNENVDWKACSHACRACYQIIELAKTGFIQYPLAKAPEIMAVKSGSMDWRSEVEPLIASLIEEAEKALLKVPENPKVKENQESIILRYYAQFLR